MTDLNEQLRVRVVYSRPSKFDDGRPCQVCCEADDERATDVHVDMGNYKGEMRFQREIFTGRNDKGHYQHEGDWPLEFDQLLRMLNEAFERGKAQQRKDTRDLFEKVMGIS